MVGSCLGLSDIRPCTAPWQRVATAGGRMLDKPQGRKPRRRDMVRGGSGERYFAMGIWATVLGTVMRVCGQDSPTNSACCTRRWSGGRA